MSDPIVTIDAKTAYKWKPDDTPVLAIYFKVSPIAECDLHIQVIADETSMATHEITISQFTKSLEINEYLTDGQFVMFTVTSEETKETITFEVRDHETLLVPICQDTGLFQFRITKYRQDFNRRGERVA